MAPWIVFTTQELRGAGELPHGAQGDLAGGGEPAGGARRGDDVGQAARVRRPGR